ncbi:hypothetical protein [Neobacillus terrae]|uniref:hypothetical protein n=1 Tax=Neobacillus terrae TaxID=3034837 RepID=UPI00140A18DE|nr:hypothetical protein [Neobacillus terrae]NHM33678.1 hypothetical protein [Neobacillus terrae]
MKVLLALLTLFSSAWLPGFSGITEPDKKESLLAVADAKKEAPQNYRNVRSTGKNGRYIITGELRIKGEKLFYTVEDGHNELAKGVVPIKAKEWTSFKFEIKIPQEKLPQNGSVVLYLYDEEQNATKPVLLEQRKS